MVRVTDSGPGVPEEALTKLFLPFYRIDDARGRATGGVGLGLAITERAVQLHGGSVRATNRPQGGLMVEIRLPAAPVDDSTSMRIEKAAALQAEPASINHHPSKLLIEAGNFPSLSRFQPLATFALPRIPDTQMGVICTA